MKGVAKEFLGVSSPFKSGRFSNFYMADLEGKQYVYREFKDKIPQDIIRNIANLTDERYSEEYLTPLFLVHNFSKNAFDGYLTEPNDRLITLDEIEDYERKKEVLREAKSIITKLHKYYGRVHGDVNISSILFDTDSEKVFLQNFDNSIKIGQSLESQKFFSEYIKNYLKYNPLDYSVDIYSFNLNTLAILSGLTPHEVIKGLLYGQFNLPEENIMVRKLSKELLLDGTKKKYSGKFIIDYIE